MEAEAATFNAMREPLTEARLLEFFEKLGRRADGPGRIYITGGGTAILFGWRATTIDIDLKLDPEPPGVFRAIAQLKDELNLNVELAAPDDFVPQLPGWRDRSQWISTHGRIDFYHYDYYGQALAKIERGLTKDVSDVREMMAAGLVDPHRLLKLFEEVKPELERYPAIDAPTLEAKLRSACE